MWLEQLNLGDEVELSVRQDSLVVRAAHVPREGWSAAFEAMARSRDDVLVDDPQPTRWDIEEWQW
jgi:antitoxin component of MazEF toxin-antitoxin module